MESPYSKKIILRSARPLSSGKDESTSLPATRRQKLSIQLGDDDLTTKLLSVISPKDRNLGSISARNMTTKHKQRTPSSETIKLFNERTKNISKLDEERQELMSIYGELQLEYKDLLTLSKIKERREQKIENLKRKIVRLAEEKSHTQAKISNYEAISKDFLQVVETGNISQEDKNRIMSQIQRTMMINENGKLKTPKVLNIPKSFGSANEELWNLYMRFQNYFNNIKSH